MLKGFYLVIAAVGDRATRTCADLSGKSPAKKRQLRCPDGYGWPFAFAGSAWSASHIVRALLLFVVPF